MASHSLSISLSHPRASQSEFLQFLSQQPLQLQPPIPSKRIHCSKRGSSLEAQLSRLVGHARLARPCARPARLQCVAAGLRPRPLTRAARERPLLALKRSRGGAAAAAERSPTDPVVFVSLHSEQEQQLLLTSFALTSHSQVISSSSSHQIHQLLLTSLGQASLAAAKRVRLSAKWQPFN